MFCWFCGNELKNGALYCHKCGNRVMDDTADAIFHDEEKENGWKPEEPNKSLKKLLIPLITGGAFIVFVIVLVVASNSQWAEESVVDSYWQDEYTDDYEPDEYDDYYDQDVDKDEYYDSEYDESYDEDYNDSEDDYEDDSSEGDTELPYPSPTDNMVEGIRSSWHRSDGAWDVSREEWGNLLWDWNYQTNMCGGPTFSGKSFVFSFSEVCSFTGFYYQGDLDQRCAKPKRIRFMFYSINGDGASSIETVDDLPNSYEEQAINFGEYHEGDHIEVSVLDGYGTPSSIMLSEFHFY